MRTSNPPPTPQQWQAIVDRDASQDGGFVYGVLSTGIFCVRPVPRARLDPEVSSASKRRKPPMRAASGLSALPAR